MLPSPLPPGRISASIRSRPLACASMRPAVLTVTSSKGGVGKTTTVAALADVLAESGDTVVCVDADPQADLTVGAGYDPSTIPLERSTAAVWAAALDGDPGRPGLGDLAIPVAHDGRMRLLPATPDLARVVKLVEADAWGITAAREAVRANPPDVDWVLIDTPPTLATYVLSLVCAADYVLIPVNPDLRAFRGADRILAEVGRIRDRGLNPDLRVGGIFLVAVDRVTRISRDAVAFIERYAAEHPVYPPVPGSIKVTEAASAGLPVTRFAPDHQTAVAYREIARRVRKLKEER